MTVEKRLWAIIDPSPGSNIVAVGTSAGQAPMVTTDGKNVSMFIRAATIINKEHDKQLVLVHYKLDHIEELPVDTSSLN